MKITATLQSDCVVCTFPNGDSIELSMVSVEGEDINVDADIHAALAILKENIHLFAPDLQVRVF